MKQFVAMLVMLTVLAIPTMPANGAIANPKQYEQCHDRDGKILERKDCEPTSCGCLFHEIAEFFGEIFG